MKISSNSKYKSLPPLAELTLPDFVVLYGVNGAGKTHLLQGLTNPQVKNILDDNGAPLSRRKFVDTNNLAPNDSTVISWDNLKQSPLNLWNNLSNYKQNKQNNPLLLLFITKQAT